MQLMFVLLIELCHFPCGSLLGYMHMIAYIMFFCSVLIFLVFINDLNVRQKKYLIYVYKILQILL
jgi:hypothetical protein